MYSHISGIEAVCREKLLYRIMRQKIIIYTVCHINQILLFTGKGVSKCILCGRGTGNCQSYWLSVESERVSSSQAHSSLSSVTAEKQISLIMHRVHADDRRLADQKQEPGAQTEFPHNHKITRRCQADDNQ